MPLSAYTILQRLTDRGRLKHMQALIALNDLGSMGRAAASMGMTQPAMSQLVAELEALIETQLFLRHSKGVEPTATARELLPVCRRIAGAVEEGAERIASRQRREGGLVRVASTAAGTGAMLDRVLPRFADRYPHIQVQVSTVIGQALDASFAEDEFDIVCCRARAVVPDEWVFVPCVADALVAVVGPTHPLADKPQVTRADLEGAVWVQNFPTSEARRGFDEMLGREGWVEPDYVRVASRVPVLSWTMLKDGTRVAYIPRSVVEPWIDVDALKVLAADIDRPLPPIGCHWQPESAGSATRLLVEHLAALEPRAHGDGKPT